MDVQSLPVKIVGCIYVVMGLVGFIYHFPEFSGSNGFRFDVFGVEVIRLLALVSGVFLLRGENWARWLALVWIGFHVIISAFHAPFEFAMHCLFFALIAWSLFRPKAGVYFHGRKTGLTT